MNSSDTQAVANPLSSSETLSHSCLGHQHSPRLSRSITEQFSCAGCGTAMARTDVAVAVRLALDSPRDLSIPHNNGCGWACIPCGNRPPAQAARTHKGDGFWWTHGAVDPALPCEGCGQSVRLRTHHRRTRVLCSNACRVRTNPSHRDNTSNASGDGCPQCGARVMGIRSSRRYCSSACRQRAYRIRTSTGSMSLMR